MERHYLDLADARTLPTPGLITTHGAVTDLLKFAAMGVVHGMPGWGSRAARRCGWSRRGCSSS